MGSRRLTDVVAEIVDAAVRGEVVNKRNAAVDAWDTIDPDGQYIAGIDGLLARVNGRARSVRLKTATHAEAAQDELPFSLPAAVSMDVDDHTMMATRRLTRDQFVQAIEIREHQIANDTAALREWRQALRYADDIWARHPDWPFGRCLDAMRERAARGDAGAFRLVDAGEAR